MITEFQLLDNVGEVIGEGEIENAAAEKKLSLSTDKDSLSFHHHDDSDRDGESHEVTSSLSPRTSAVYRLFSGEFPNGSYKEFETLEAMFAASEGVAIQPMMFPCLARTRQLGLFPEDRKK